MSSKLKQLKEIDTKTKYTVSGYIRKKHKLLFKSSNYLLFQNIPISVSSLCTLYYHCMDHFEIINKQLSVSNNNKTLTKHENGMVNSSYGSWLIQSTSDYIYKWNLEYSDNYFIVGIASEPFGTDLSFCNDKRGKHYCFCPSFNTIHCHKYSSGTFRKCEKRLSLDKEIGLELDLKKKQLSVFNDKDKMVIFDNLEIGKDIAYRLAVRMCYTDSTITII